MKQYLTGADSLLNNTVINPHWPENERPLSWIKYIVVHHEAMYRPHDYQNTPRYESEAQYQNETSIPGSRGIQYHAHIDNQGTVTWLRPLTTYLWHCGDLEANKQSIAVCVDGNFETQQPTREQYEALKELLDFWCSPASGAFPADQSTVFAHKKFSATACCGKNLVSFVDNYRQGRGEVAIPDVPYDWPEYQPRPVDTIQPPAAPPVVPPQPQTEPSQPLPLPTETGTGPSGDVQSPSSEPINSNNTNKSGDSGNVQIAKWLEGKKTILGVLAGAVYSVLIYFNVVPSNELVWGALAAWTGISFRLALNKEK